jgi:uncharacterized membrane protein YfcA
LTVSAAGLAGLLVLAGVAAYLQTLTGFAFGLIMMGGIGLSGLMPLPDAAVLVGCMVLVNAAQVLARGWRDIAWREFWPVIVASTVALAAGYGMLGVMVSASIDWLKLALGIVIIASSIQLALQPAPLQARSPTGSFIFFGAAAGLMGGLFSTAGPPLGLPFLPATALGRQHPRNACGGLRRQCRDQAGDGCSRGRHAP